MNIRFDSRRFRKCSDALVLCTMLMISSGAIAQTNGFAISQDGESERLNPALALPTIGISVAKSQITLQKTSGMTCAQTPVSALRLDLGQAELTWKNTSALSAGAIVVAFENRYIKGNQYICEIDGAEFDAVFGTRGASVGESITSVSGCNIQCGGIEVTTGAPAFAAVGTVSVFGTTQIGGTSRVQQRATIPLVINYVP